MPLFHIITKAGEAGFWATENSAAAENRARKQYGDSAEMTTTEVHDQPQSFERLYPINPRFTHEIDDGWVVKGSNGFLYYYEAGEILGPYDEETGVCMDERSTASSRPCGILVRMPTEEEERLERQPPIMFTRPSGRRRLSE